ncbi:phosphotransferase family protein [Lacticigenium naphthae]|uniref:phosphotransferase family protein n=1 Tax=Lacticigenium naphthae TaxID=515351 RepID=UPI00042A2ED9|nr:phosphotransferase family protein [Lacticigenium naphthae]
MELERETGWKLHPIGGDTGQAYMGIKNEEKLFLKRNSSPFLAALSVEGVTPRLIWTKRIGNGDVLTAQEWCNGRTLKNHEMSSAKVAQLMNRIHYSSTLRRMLLRVGGRKLAPSDFLISLKLDLPLDLRQHPLIIEGLNRLENSSITIAENEMTVCHGDVNKKNWLQSETDTLYLVDWDSAILADPAYDIGMLFSNYIEENAWEKWLKDYGVDVSPMLLKRIHWYVLFVLIQQIKLFHHQTRYHLMNEKIVLLKEYLAK